MDKEKLLINLKEMREQQFKNGMCNNDLEIIDRCYGIIKQLTEKQYDKMMINHFKVI